MGNTVIINLQNTPSTEDCLFQIYAKTDTVMAEVMKKLNLTIPEFKLQRKIIFGAVPNGDNIVTLLDFLKTNE